MREKWQVLQDAISKEYGNSDILPTFGTHVQPGRELGAARILAKLRDLPLTSIPEINVQTNLEKDSSIIYSNGKGAFSYHRFFDRKLDIDSTPSKYASTRQQWIQKARSLDFNLFMGKIVEKRTGENQTKIIRNNDPSFQYFQRSMETRQPQFVNIGQFRTGIYLKENLRRNENDSDQDRQSRKIVQAIVGLLQQSDQSIRNATKFDYKSTQSNTSHSERGDDTNSETSWEDYGSVIDSDPSELELDPEPNLKARQQILREIQEMEMTTQIEQEEQKIMYRDVQEQEDQSDPNEIFFFEDIDIEEEAVKESGNSYYWSSEKYSPYRQFFATALIFRERDEVRLLEQWEAQIDLKLCETESDRDREEEILSALDSDREETPKPVRKKVERKFKEKEQMLEVQDESEEPTEESTKPG